MEKTNPIADNETFVRLVQVAQDDPEFRDQILSILSLDSFNRKSVLNSFIENMRLNKVSDDLIEALAGLLDDDVAEAVLKIIDGEKLN